MPALRATPPLGPVCFLPAAPLPRTALLHAVSHRLPTRRPAPVPCRTPSRRVVAASADRDNRPDSLTGLFPPSVEALLLVNAVPFVWGTYTPVIKWVTNLNPHAPLIALNFISALVGYLTLLLIRSTTEKTTTEKTAPDDASNDEARTPLRVASELGLYLAFGAIFHLAAFGATTPSRASFLVQLTSLFVPLMDVLTGATISRSVIGAASLTVFGAAFLAGPADIVNAANAADAGTSFLSSVRTGDILAVVAAFFYSLQIVRTDRLAPQAGNPVEFADSTLRVQSICAGSFVVVAALFHKISLSDWVADVQQLAPHDVLVSVLGMLWIGGVTSGFSLWAQIRAQERVGASRASIFFAAQPVWSVGLAVAAGLDSLSSSELVGGTLIVLGGFLLAAAGELDTE